MHKYMHESGDYDESKRNEILAMADNLETKINEVSMSDKVKEEVKEYIANVRKVLNQDTLESVEKDIVAINSILKNYKIEYSGEGNKVIYQSPEPEYYVSDGSTVKLMLGD